ncbi:MAG: RNA-binding protein [bacterium]|nr:RNA-binding protein [bacterium]
MITTLFVGNLPWAVTEADLQAAVAQYTQVEVISARVPTDRATGRSRGFGFVEVPADKAEEVIAKLNGSEWEGRTLTVNEAKPRERTGGGRRMERGR